jgi:hypothetical protein
MTFRRWFLPLGMCSPLAHAPDPLTWQSFCGMWDLSRFSSVEDSTGSRPRCAACITIVDVLDLEADAVEAGASHASGENRTPERAPSGPVVGASPLATPRKVKP